MPFKYQILITPLVMILILCGLVSFTLFHHFDIKSRNEQIRQWARITDRMHLAIASAQRLQSISERMIQAGSDAEKVEDLHFSYLEQYRIFSENVLYPQCVDKMSDDTRAFIAEAEKKIAYHDKLMPAVVNTSINALLPRLESVYNSFWAQKRLAYIDYYDEFQAHSSQLLNVSLTLVAICVGLGVLLSVWVIRSTRQRLGSLVMYLNRLANGQAGTSDTPALDVSRNPKDELDQLALGIYHMTDRLMNSVAVEKMLQGAEEERKRIAMDLHDETLSDLTAISRQLETLKARSPADAQQQVASINEAVATTQSNMRRIIDDLHPRTLDLLGLEAALRSCLEQLNTLENAPQYHLEFQVELEQKLTTRQKLNIYRISLELVNNIVRHAQCSRFELSFRLLDKHLQIQVEDNGVGMSPEQRKQSFGHGLVNIEERARAMGADYSWQTSRFSSGLRFNLSLELTP